MARWWTAEWRGVVDDARILELGDPFEALTWHYARQHACAVLGLAPGDVEVTEVKEGSPSRQIDYPAEAASVGAKEEVPMSDAIGDVSDGEQETEVKSEAKMMTLTLDDFDVNLVVAWVGERALKKTFDKLEYEIAKAVEKAVESVTEEAIKDRLTAAVEKAIEEGWQKTNHYGERTGPTVTLKERISAFLDSRQRWDSDYNTRETSLVDYVLQKMITKKLETEFTEIFKMAKETFKKAVDANLQDKVRSALTQALGIKS